MDIDASDIHSILLRMIELEEKQDKMQIDIATLTSSMNANTSALGEFIELGKGLKFGLKALKYVEATATWFAKVSVACALAWAAWKYGVAEAIRQAQNAIPK